VTNKSIPDWIKVVFTLAACVAVATTTTYVLYGYTRDLLIERLRERITAIVSTGAVQIDARDVLAVGRTEDMSKPQFEKLVRQLVEFRDANSNLKYAYIMRQTDDPNKFEFVADADSLGSLIDLDENQNGKIDADEQPPKPGDPYKVNKYPVLRDEAFKYPVAERELAPDRWGLMIAAFAPIRDHNGDAIAILGIDVIADDFLVLTRATLMPFLVFILILILILTVLTVALVRVNRARVEAYKELDRQKDELISIVSHQLATPVTSIKWYLEMMLDGDMGQLSKEQQDQLKIMQGVTGDLVDLIGMLLDVSRIQLGRMKVDRTDLNLAEFFKEVLAVIEPKAMQKKQKFMKNLPNGLPVAMLDKRLTRMTLENLLSNAVKYTPEGGKVDFTVTISDGTMRYEVRDSGYGIPESEQGKIFGKLFRASNVQKQDGNGLGLFVAKGAVEAQGGRIWFESKEGKGTAFFVALPIMTEKVN
jgi:signal transduction histidine kinase